MAQTVLDAVLKCLKKFVKVDEQFEVLKATWTASMKNLEANDHITESIPWLPVPTSSGRRREAMNDPQVSARNTERDVRENVPQILHPDWTAADRKRANEVNTQKRSRTPVLIFWDPQVQNATLTEPEVFDCAAVTKGKMCAIFANNIDENLGYPFWIGKVLTTTAPKEIGSEESDEEDDMFAHGTVQFHGYVQTVKANEEPSGKYEPHLEHGAKKKGRSSTTSKKVVTDVPLNQVAYIFDSLTAGKTILKKDKLWISYYCEVAKRQATFECPGVEKFNDELGLKHMPFT